MIKLTHVKRTRANRLQRVRPGMAETIYVSFFSNISKLQYNDLREDSKQSYVGFSRNPFLGRRYLPRKSDSWWFHLLVLREAHAKEGSVRKNRRELQCRLDVRCHMWRRDRRNRGRHRGSHGESQLLPQFWAWTRLSSKLRSRPYLITPCYEVNWSRRRNRN